MSVMFPEQDIDEFMYNMTDSTEELTEQEARIILESYKMMLKVAQEGKRVYTFDQEWLM